jgi:acyl-CoA synthetase (AMP-forming)/AMP-acid ligase II
MTINVASIYEQFEKVSREHPEKPALIYLGVRYSFSQLREATESLAAIDAHWRDRHSYLTHLYAH